jgi:hypothetical protein
MYPDERSLVSRLADEPFALVGVNSDPAEDYREAIEREDITWSNFWDGGDTRGPISTKWGVRGWPTIYILDHEGVIRNKGKRGEELHALVDELLFELTGNEPPAHVEGDGVLRAEEKEHGDEEGHNASGGAGG